MNRLRMPSPAIVVAVLALVAALAGTAVAEQATTSALTKKKVKKIANKQIDKRFPITREDQSPDQQTLWANVQSNGTIAEQSGGISVQALGTGSYVIDFGEDVSGRALMATGVNARVIADATLCNGGTGVGSDCSPDAPNDSQHVGVNTALAAVAPAVLTNLPFHVAALPE
jgi:uncharacterized protein (DUF2141 family)